MSESTKAECIYPPWLLCYMHKPLRWAWMRNLERLVLENPLDTIGFSVTGVITIATIIAVALGCSGYWESKS